MHTLIDPDYFFPPLNRGYDHADTGVGPGCTWVGRDKGVQQEGEISQAQEGHQLFNHERQSACGHEERLQLHSACSTTKVIVDYLDSETKGENKYNKQELIDKKLFIYL